MNDLHPIQIRLLYSLNDSDKPIQRKTITQKFRNVSAKELYQLVDDLIKLKLVTKYQKITPHCRIIPTFYNITDDGKQWIKKYMEQ